MSGFHLHDDDPAAGIIYALAEINFEGNILPLSWFRFLRYPNGHPHLNAIMVLSDIVYWYRPIEVRDPYGHYVAEYRKKFEGAKLQRRYAYYTNAFGLTVKQGRDAIDFLADDGVITKDVISRLKVKGGATLNNVMFLEIIPERLREITRPLHS